MPETETRTVLSDFEKRLLVATVFGAVLLHHWVGDFPATSFNTADAYQNAERLSSIARIFGDALLRELDDSRINP